MEPLAMAVGYSSSMPWTSYTAGAVLVWIASLLCYRRFFHPLATIPGPFLPAVTRLYIWYYNVVRDGRFYKKIEELHAKYGIRTNFS
jgi:hypothetical protein